MCHQGIGMAVSLLSRRPGDTSKGLLEERKDLSAEFVYHGGPHRHRQHAAHRARRGQ